MKLDDNQKKDLLEKLAFLSETECFVCKKKDWLVAEIVFELREFQFGSLLVGGHVLPLISVTCQSCGANIFFNAISLGYIPKSEEK